jgi:hypothetical protein
MSRETHDAVKSVAVGKIAVRFVRGERAPNELRQRCGLSARNPWQKDESLITGMLCPPKW